MAVTPSRWTPCGIRRAICAMLSKPCASPRPEEDDHAICSSPRPRRLSFAGVRPGCTGLLHPPGGDRGLQARPQPRRGEGQLLGLPLRRLCADPAARRKVQKGFLAGRGDQDDEGLWRADRRYGRCQNRRISRRNLLISALQNPRAYAARGYCIAANSPKVGTQIAANSAKTRHCAAIRGDFAKKRVTICATKPAITRVSCGLRACR